MKFTIVTVSYNAQATIADALRSVAEQSYTDVEHIVIDGASTDSTTKIVESMMRPGGVLMSEPDTGLYNAMNKGINLATGDVIGLLNSDDLYADNDVLARVARNLVAASVDAVFCDVGFFRNGSPENIIRRYNSGYFRPDRLGWGWMPAHPGMFLTKKAYDIVGRYSENYKIAADFEFIARAFGKLNLSYTHMAEIAVLMRVGGISTRGLKAKMIINTEVLKACRENGIYSNPAMLLLKYPRKVLETLK